MFEVWDRHDKAITNNSQERRIRQCQEKMEPDPVEKEKEKVRDKVKVASEGVVWGALRQVDPPATVFVRSAGRENHTSAAYLASSANVRSAEPS